MPDRVNKFRYDVVWYSFKLPLTAARNEGLNVRKIGRAKDPARSIALVKQLVGYYVPYHFYRCTKEMYWNYLFWEEQPRFLVPRRVMRSCPLAEPLHKWRTQGIEAGCFKFKDYMGREVSLHNISSERTRCCCIGKFCWICGGDDRPRKKLLGASASSMNKSKYRSFSSVTESDVTYRSISSAAMNEGKSPPTSSALARNISIR